MAFPSGECPVTTRRTRMAGLYVGAPTRAIWGFPGGSGGEGGAAVAALVAMAPPEPVGHAERGRQVGEGGGVDRRRRGVEQPRDHRARLAERRAAAQQPAEALVVGGVEARQP